MEEFDIVRIIDFIIKNLLNSNYLCYNKSKTKKAYNEIQKDINSCSIYYELIIF
jgi:hypothetical protein